ncbi:hypothetical protein L7F22_031926 [Adiantum nelumboides]|nr:hypothetical protein [Adiantum nelumboides]
MQADHGEAKRGRVLDDDASTSDAALSGLQPAIVSAARSVEGGAARVPEGDAEGSEDPQAGGSEGMGGIGGGGASGGRGRVVDDGASGDGGDGGDGSRRENFPGLYENMVIIDLSAFHTPPKNAFNRSQTLKARSRLFSTHPNIQGGLTHMYDPFYSQRRRVLLYHGTRSFSLGSFKSKGIFPKLRPNEFSVTYVFCTSNSLRQAFEHPNKHVAGNTVDPVSVLVFEVDVAVLHGEKLPIGESSEFKCKWFPGDTPARLKAWSDFCAANLSTEVLPHTYDVVIGPICYRLDEDGYAKLCGEMPNSIPLTQVAFCTPSARAWLQKCFKRVYMERRST